MSLLSQASLCVTPNAYKEGKLYSVIPSDGSGDFTFTRATTATRVNSDGLVELVPYNLLRYSEQFDNASWTKSNSSVTANSTTSPSGITDADTLTADGTSNRHEVTQLISFTSGLAYTFSVYIKKNTNDFAQLTLGGVAFSSLPFANFNVNNGTLGSTGGSATSTITSVGNGWYRCTLTATATATQGDRVYLVMTTSPTSIRRESNTLSTSVYLWGAQLEVGSYATSYIPTTTASVTRNQDLCSKTGISSLIGQTEGTLFGEFTYSRDDGGTRRLLSLTDGGTTNRITTYIDSNDKISIYIVDSSSVQVDIRGLVALVVGTTYKYAIAYKLNDVKLYVNGVEDGSDTSATIPSCSQLYVGSENGNNPSYFNWNQVLLFPTRLTDDQLAQLTTI